MVHAHAQVVVTDDGRPTLRVPISVPPGIAGFAPSLSLTYTGGPDRGMGAGWVLEGISSIGRCASTKDVDGKRADVLFNANDHLCLDGQRLIGTDHIGQPLPFPQVLDLEPPPSWHFKEYRLETDRLVRVRQYRHGEQNLSYFKVFDESGSIRTYGQSEDTIFFTAPQPSYYVNQEAVRAWYLSQSVDRAGNLISYRYSQTGDFQNAYSSHTEFVPTEIRYRGAGGAANSVRILFEYEARPASESLRRTNFAAGVFVASKSRLAAIKVALDGQADHKVYTLTYDQGPHTGKSRLTQVAECAPPGGGCLPAYAFQYTAGQVGWLANESFKQDAAGAPNGLATRRLYEAGMMQGMMRADFNGDGRIDFLLWKADGSGNDLYLSEGVGNYRFVPAGSGAGQFNLATETLFGHFDRESLNYSGCFWSIEGDFNGDGLQDILRYASPGRGSNGSPNACPSGRVSLLYFSNGDGSFTIAVLKDAADQSPLPLLSSAGSINPYPPKEVVGYGTFAIGDFDDDGILDIVSMQAGRAAVTEAGIESARFRCTLPTSERCEVKLYKGRGDGSFDASQPAYFYSGNPLKAWMPIGLGQPGDFNADGTADLPADEPNKIFASDGQGNFISSWYIPRVPKCPDDYLTVGLGDFTADGQLDALCGYGRIVLGGNQELRTITSVSGSWYWGGEITLDVNADGQTDFISCSANGERELYLSKGDGTFTGYANLSAFGLPLGCVGPMVGNFVGTGSAELFLEDGSFACIIYGNCNHSLYAHSDATPPDLLKVARTPGGAATTITYAPLTQTTRYTSERLAVIAASVGSRSMAIRPRVDRTLSSTDWKPYIETAPVMHIVTAVAADTGVGTAVTTTEFAYRGHRVDRLGRGSLGFGEVRQQSPAADGSSLLTVVKRKIQIPPYVGSQAITETYLGPMSPITQPQTGQLLSRVENVYCDQASAPGAETIATATQPCPIVAKVFKPYLRQSTTTGSDLSGAPLPTVVTTNTYSGGYPTVVQKVTSGSGPAGSQSFISLITNEYWPDSIAGDNWLVGLLKKTTTTNTVPNSLAATAASAGTAPKATATAGP